MTGPFMWVAAMLVPGTVKSMRVLLLLSLCASLVLAPLTAANAQDPPTRILTTEITSRTPTPLVMQAEPLSTVVVRGESDLTGPIDQVLQADQDGKAELWVKAFKHLQVSTGGDSVSIAVLPQFTPLPSDLKRPRKTLQDPPGKGVGANASITPLSKHRIKAMRGASWSPGCVPLGQLREVFVNYIDPDGYVKRGSLVVRQDVAKKVATLFSDLFDKGYRFHSIRPVDEFGPSPFLGADDYESMRKSNTSAFNCRYVVGYEKDRRLSPHWGGRALDINPYENPYLTSRGALPDSYYLPQARRSANPMGLTPSSFLVKRARQLGWTWGGEYGDYHHFDYRG